MKKGTKFAALLLSLALIIPACQEKGSEVPASESGSPSESESQSQEVNYTVSISNKQALQAPDWHAKGDSRKVEIEVEPRANVAQLVREGVIQITSSDTEKLTITGQMANPVAEGQATITVTCGQSSDSVQVTIAEEEVAEVVNYGTEQQPLTISQVLTEVAKEKLENRSYSAQYFFARATLKTAVAAGKFTLTDGTKDMEVSSAVLEEGKQATDYKIDDIILLRAYVRADSGKPNGYYFSYNQGASGNNAPTIIGWEDGGGTPITVETHEVTVAEALTVGNALQDNETTTDLYIVTGFITSVKYHWSEAHPTVTFNIGDTADAAAANQLNIYSAACTQELDAKILVGAKISVKGNIQKYVANNSTTIELVGGTELTVITEAPTVNTYEVTVAQALTAVNALEDNATTADWYKVTGYVVQVTYAFANGTMSFTMGDTADATDLLTCFKTATTEAIAAKVLAGAKITVTGNLQKYIKNNAVVPELVNGKDIVIVSEAGGGGGDTPVDPPVVETFDLELTYTNLGLAENGTYAKNTNRTVTVDGYSLTLDPDSKEIVTGNKSTPFTADKLGLAIQLKKSQGDTGIQFNTAFATGSVIKMKFYATYDTEGLQYLPKVKIGSGEAAGPTNELNASNAVVGTKTSYTMYSGGADRDVYEYVLTYDISSVNNQTISIINANSASYITSIGINFGEAQQEVLPIGNYLGHATAVAAMGGAEIFTMIALGNEKAFIEVALPDPYTIKLTTTYTYAAATNTVTITDDDLGTITAVFNETNHALEQVTLSNNDMASAIADNGEITLNNPTLYWDCEGTTAELNQVLAKRVRPSDSWNTALEDVAADTTNFVGGESGVARSGSSDKALGLTLRNDFEAQQNVQGIGFWVYNPTSSDLNIRTWTFGATSYGSNSEIGALTAKANGWTFCRMGFSARNIYNFNICVWNEYGQTAEATLTFDNICLY